MASEIADAIRSAGTLTSLLKQLEGLESYGALMTSAASLQEKLSQALLANATSAEEKMTLLNRTQRLTEENEKLKDWISTSNNYELENRGYGAFAYVYKPKIKATKPPHWICTNCFDNRIASILQNKPKEGYSCPRCKLALPARYIGNKQPE